jgi:hypothetical protein
MPEDKKPDDLAQFASDLQRMRHRAIDLHLYATGQRLDTAIRMLASEIAGDFDGDAKFPAAPKRQTVLYVNGRAFHCPEATPCPDCSSTELEMRTYGGNWDDADTRCAKCGKLIHRAWFPI